MTSATLETVQAQAVIEARLGRTPQDMLEAAVVLEAYVGVPAAGALNTGRRIMDPTSERRRPSTGILPRTTPLEGLALEAIAFIAAMIAIACWAAPLSDVLGAGLVKEALLIALPLAVALQWAVNSRYLSRPRGTVHLGRHPIALVLFAGALIVLLSAAFGLSGLIAGLLAVMWTGGTILIASRLPDEYMGLVLLATAGIYAGLPPVEVLAGAAAVTTIMVILAITITISNDEPTHKPGRWSRVAMAGAIGLGIGALLVADRSINWSLGVVPALALLPSTVASFWGGSHLWRFQDVLPQAIAGIPVSGGAVRGAAGVPVRLLLGAIGRLVFLTTALSLVLMFGAQLFDVTMSGASVLVGFGLVALGTLLVGLLESVGRGPWALSALIVAVSVELVVSRSDDGGLAGAGLIAGAAVVVALALPMAIFVMSRPATTLATRLRVS